jgi:hypothetical protein
LEPIGVHWSWEIDIAELIQMVITIGAHCSPLELEIEKRDNAELILMVITIGAHWSPMELEIEKRDRAELILMVSWRLIREPMPQFK